MDAYAGDGDCMMRWGWFLVVALALGFGAWGPPVHARARQPTGVTDVRLFVPFREGRLVAGLAAVARLSGRCFAASIASQGRSDAWRCMSDNLILDPCYEGTPQ